MKKLVLVVFMVIVVSLFFTATAAFAENLFVRTVKGLVVSPIISPAEFLLESGKSLLKGHGPITSTLRGTSQATGRILQDVVGIVNEEATIPYFETNELTSMIDPPEWVAYADYAATFAGIGVVGVNSNWWGGSANAWTRTKAVAIGSAIGATTASVVEEVVLEK